MKKTLMALTFMSLAMASAAQAEDHSATVNFHASLTNNISKCVFEVGEGGGGVIVNLHGAIGELPDEGYSARTPTKLQYQVSNDCDVNTFGLQLHGFSGSTYGTVLANTDESESAAKGIGVGVFDSDLSPIQVNGSLPIAPTLSGRYINLEMVKFKNQIPISGTVSSSLTIDIVHL